MSESQPCACVTVGKPKKGVIYPSTLDYIPSRPTYVKTSERSSDRHMFRVKVIFSIWVLTSDHQISDIIFLEVIRMPKAPGLPQSCLQPLRLNQPQPQLLNPPHRLPPPPLLLHPPPPQRPELRSIKSEMQVILNNLVADRLFSCIHAENGFMHVTRRFMQLCGRWPTLKGCCRSPPCLHLTNSSRRS